MNRGILSFLLIGSLYAASPAWSGALEDAAEGGKLYEAADYSRAVEAYGSALAKSPQDAALHFDLGNAYFRRGQPGDLGRAAASYERAFRLSPRDADVRYNLDFALRRAGESLVPPGMPSSAFVLFHVLSRGELFILHALGLWSLLLLLTLGFWKEPLRERLRFPALAAGLLWLAAGSWLIVLEWTDVKNPGVVLAQEAEVRSAPNTGAPVQFKAPEGRRVCILQEKDGWLEIGVLKEGLQGWIPAGLIERI
ncbi:MAG: tetratricopeptide repeat protein [Elusimicrobiota bacterium]|jgi:tetratricopeptide (TPR) repeat protein